MNILSYINGTPLTVDVVKRHKIATSNNMINLISHLENKFDTSYASLYGLSADKILFSNTRDELIVLGNKIDEVRTNSQKLDRMDINSSNYMSRDEELCGYDSYIYYARLIYG